MSSYKFYNTKNFYLIFFVAIALSFFIPGLFTSSFVALMVFAYIFKFTELDDGIDSYYHAKKELLTFIFFSWFFSFIVGNYTYSSVLMSDNPFVSNYIAILIIIGCFLGLYKLKNSSPRKFEKDYPNIVQERMYDDILLQLDDAFNYRVINKMIDMRELDLSVVDNEKELKPSIKKEIIDIINGKRTTYYDYKLTKVNNIEETIKFLNTPIKAVEETDKFIRYIFQLCNKKLEPLKEEFDFKRALEKYSNILEYALIELFIHTRNFKNVPMANMIAYANESSYSKHVYGALDSHTATSIGRFGIAYYVGYYLFNDYLNFIENNKKKESHES